MGEVRSLFHMMSRKDNRVACSFYPKRFAHLISASNTFKYSFFTRTIKDWNSLPNNIIEQFTVDNFTSAQATNIADQ